MSANVENGEEWANELSDLDIGGDVKADISLMPVDFLAGAAMSLDAADDADAEDNDAEPETKKRKAVQEADEPAAKKAPKKTAASVDAQKEPKKTSA